MVGTVPRTPETSLLNSADRTPIQIMLRLGSGLATKELRRPLIHQISNGFSGSSIIATMYALMRNQTRRHFFPHD